MKHYILLSLLVLFVCCEPDWTKVNDIFNEALQDRVFPGASLTVANMTHILYRKNFGYFSYSNQLHDVPITNETKFDAASVTKIMATTLAVMNLVSRNKLKLTDFVSDYWPNYETNNKGNTTIGNLLLHNSGLHPDYPGLLPDTPEKVLQYITNAELDYPIGTQMSYSNLGFLVLGKIIEKVTGQSFEDFFQQNKIIAGFENSNFNPPQSQWYNIIPTKYDSEVRKRIVRGEPHERVAYLFGGVTGHNGLFTDSDDLTRFMRIILSGGQIPGEPNRILEQEIVDLFTTRVQGLPYNNFYAYGFDTLCPGKKMIKCFGINASTGILAWGDKEKKIIYVVMSNRIHPDVNNWKIINYIPLIADQVMEVLGY